MVVYRVVRGGKGVLLRIILMGRDKYEGGQFSLDMTPKEARQMMADIEAAL